MIYSLAGTLVHKGADHAVVECAGVGYLVHCGARHLAAMPPPGSELRVLTHLVHREDAMLLLGFATADDRDLFLLLCGVDKVGPKLAMSLLGVLSAADLAAAIVENDPRRLTQVPGVGPKLAQRIVLELKDRLSGRREPLPESPGPPPSEFAEAELALLSLGYSAREAHGALARIPAGTPIEDAIRLAIGALSEV
ncbi:MAG: Holliday junction branch migration protein RuvA [Candidatus Sericytochromatia bacterium]|nr:Holliday junction branch migration protein RuvA [Candidatus Tanganyikabacteria bacterium]